MIRINNKSNCCGCSACVNICPKSCISMRMDEEGFLYPNIDLDECISCNKCSSVCPILNNQPENHYEIKAYAAHCMDDEILKRCSSGGIFALIARKILQRQGIVFGASFDAHFGVIHVLAKDSADLELLYGSKYVQSDIGNTYQQAKQYLDKGIMVLFSGTPCQVEGLLCYLGKDYGNLITQDIVCHGVPSPLVWYKYLSTKGIVEDVSFRDKTEGWLGYKFRLHSDTHSLLEDKNDNTYMRSFLSDLTLRPSCYECMFKKKERRSDITLADFWGIKEVDPQMYNRQGTSLVVINSEKGDALFESISESMKYKKISFDDAIKYNSCYVKSTKMPEGRSTFIDEIINDDFDSIVEKYCKKTKISILKKIMKRLRKRI